MAAEPRGRCRLVLPTISLCIGGNGDGRETQAVAADVWCGETGTRGRLMADTRGPRPRGRASRGLWNLDGLVIFFWASLPLMESFRFYKYVQETVLNH